MTLFQKKIWICFMGFSVLSIFNSNHTYAYTSAKNESINKVTSYSAAPLKAHIHKSHKFQIKKH